MAILDNDGLKISYASDELIDELERDIKEFGTEHLVMVWVKNINGAKIITNYDFITDEMPFCEKELLEDERLEKLTMGNLLMYLKKQNEIL